VSTNKHTNPAYISHVHLKGYKSIIDTEVELHPGLNIIIGPNGSGKTNFLEFLWKVGIIKFKELPNQISGNLNFYFQNDKDIRIYHFKKILKYNEESQKVEPNLKETLKYGSINIDSDKHKMGKSGVFFLYPLLNKFPKWYQISPTIISYGLPKIIQNLSQSLSFILKRTEIKGKPNFYYDEYEYNPQVTEGIKKILEASSSKYLLEENNEEMEWLSNNLIYNLNKFSSIKQLRVKPELELNKDKTYYRADYINFEFLIRDNWFKWNQLSDGTKRLFYIISEVTLNDGLCLVEEPEIGVHPNQYRKILTFLKEQAKYKQIIITTHAPKTLDILEDDELDRIILTRYEKDLGTKMRHLSNDEQQHAVKLMKEESFFLSDFWTLTSFFDEEAEII